jgi:hypothetical protein
VKRQIVARKKEDRSSSTLKVVDKLGGRQPYSVEEKEGTGRRKEL